MNNQHPWIIPSLDEPKVNTVSQAETVSQQNIEAQARIGYQEGFAKGESQWLTRIAELNQALNDIKQMSIEIDSHTKMATIQFIQQLIKNVCITIAEKNDDFVHALVEKAIDSIKKNDNALELTAGTKVAEKINPDKHAYIKLKTDPNMDPYAFRVDSSLQSVIFDFDQVILSALDSQNGVDDESVSC